MKFCPECGTKLSVGTAKFCTNYGKNLWETPVEIENESEITREKQEEQKGQTVAVAHDTTNTQIHSLGIKLEEMVDQILRNEGYSTERRKKLMGNSNIDHEIDVLAKKRDNNKIILAVECKNYANERKVGTEEIRNFQSKIEDLPFITDKLFVTNVQFSADAQTYANYNKIDLWNGEKLHHMHYLMNIGRLNSEQEIVLNFSLPIEVSYEQATRRLLVNPYAIKVSKAILVLYPYFVFDYDVDIRRGFLGREKIHDQGIYIVDSLSGEILYVTDNVESKISLSHFFSKDNKRNKDSEEALKDMEKNQIIRDLKTIKPNSNYKIKKITDYKIDLLKNEVPIDAARRMVLEEIAEEKKAKYEDIEVNKISLVYVPKWIVSFETTTTYNKIYRREILAASNTVLVDEIAYCPKDFFANIRGIKKMTYAVCEICGNAYCKNHIEKVKNSCFCKDHKSAIVIE